MATVKGKIVKSIGGFYHVETPCGVLVCKARGLFRLHGVSPCAGDIADVLIENENEPVITEIGERKNELVRPPLSNLDIVFIITSATEPKPNALVLDKLIFIMESKGIEPVLVFTKTDKREINEFTDIYKNAGFKVFSIDNTTGEGADEILKTAEGHTSACVGNTGVGKSSLLNHLLPGVNLETAQISRKLGRGRHTTRQVELYKLPCGGYIADTPGFSTVEESRYGTIPKSETAYYFREIRDYIAKCRYTGCSHTKEEDCAVIAAASSGKIAKSRYDSYVRIYENSTGVNYRL